MDYEYRPTTLNNIKIAYMFGHGRRGCIMLVFLFYCHSHRVFEAFVFSASKRGRRGHFYGAGNKGGSFVFRARTALYLWYRDTSRIMHNTPVT